MNPYAKELMKENVSQMSKYAQQYLRSVCQFERLHHMYMSAKNKKDVMITQKYATETYGLLAKGDMVIMLSIAHNRTSKSIGEIMNEYMQLARADRDRRFILNYY